MDFSKGTAAGDNADGELADALNAQATQWDLICDPAHVVMRYASAIRRYFQILIRNADDAEEAAQEFFLRIVASAFPGLGKTAGASRDYLMRAVRNAALNFLRDRKGPKSHRSRLPAASIADNCGAHENRAWVAGWRRCLLKRAMRTLANHEQRSPGNRCHTVLHTLAKYPDADCRTLAAYVSRNTGQSLNVVAFRKQLS